MKRLGTLTLILLLFAISLGIVLAEGNDIKDARETNENTKAEKNEEEITERETENEEQRKGEKETIKKNGEEKDREEGNEGNTDEELISETKEGGGEKNDAREEALEITEGSEEETKEENSTIYIDLEEIILDTEKKASDTEKERGKEKNETTKEFVYVNITEIEEELEEKSIEKKNETNTESETKKLEERNEEKTNDTEENTTKEEREENETKEETKKENIDEELVTKRLFLDGRVEIEFEDYETSEIEIKKKEIVETETEKRVTISSEEHFDRPLRVYSDLPSEALPEEIMIYWENEDEEVKNIEYYDEDGNGKVERASWIVEHLSTQHYKILIIPRNGGSSNSSISITTISPGSGFVSNPVNFIFDIDYFNRTALECNLTIGSTSYTFNGVEAVNYSTSFAEGNHSWDVACVDEGNNMSNSTSGTFAVRDLFAVDLGPSTMTGHSITGTVHANGGVTELWLKRPGSSDIFLENITGSYPKQFTIAKEKLSNHGMYELVATSHYYENPTVLERNFSVSKAAVTYSSPIDLGDDASFAVRIDSDVSGTYSLYVENSRLENDRGFSGDHTRTVKKEMNDEGNFDVTLEVEIDGKKYSFDFGRIKVEDERDEEDPEVKLLFPEWEDRIRNDEITFRYRVYEDHKINNCSLELFNATKSSSNVYTKDSLIFPLRNADEDLAFNDTMRNDSIVTTKLVDFDEGHYIWDVTCYDNSSNEGSDFNYFQVDLDGKTDEKETENTTHGANYSRKGEVDEILDLINEFLKKENNYGAKEKEVLDIMGISKDMAFHKKRLVQIDQDFRFNLKFMTPEKRLDREKEMNEEIDKIKEQIVLDIEVGGDYEFSKNSLDTELSEIIGNYLALTDTDIKRSALRSLIDANEDIQNNLKTRVASRKVTLTYLDEEKDIVLVQKQFQLSEDTIQTLFEVLPKELHQKAVFIVGGREIGDGIYEFDIGDLDEGEIVYYFEEDIDLKKVEETESVLFSEEIKRPSSVLTGMVSGVGDTLNVYSFFFIFLVAGIGYVGFYVASKLRIEAWKKDNNVAMIIDLISQTKQLIRKGDIENARTNYAKMKDIYKILPQRRKGFFYKEIRRILLAINKKDVMNLLTEYELAKTQKRHEDATTLHKRISEIYQKLPKKYQEKVYQRIVKKEV